MATGTGSPELFHIWDIRSREQILTWDINPFAMSSGISTQTVYSVSNE